MWYFSWVLGLGLAATFGILNAMWFEMREDRRAAAGILARDADGEAGGRP